LRIFPFYAILRELRTIIVFLKEDPGMKPKRLKPLFLMLLTVSVLLSGWAFGAVLAVEKLVTIL